MKDIFYVVCDGANRMAWIELPMWGKLRYIAAIFEDETNALEVAAQIESQTGVLHCVNRIGGPLYGTAESFAARRQA